MKNLTDRVFSEKGRTARNAYWLVKIGSIFAYTNCDHIISYAGNEYKPNFLSLGGFTHSKENPLEGGSITIGAADTRMYRNIVNKTLKNTTVEVRMIYLGRNDYLIGVELIADGRVSGYDFDYESRNLTIYVAPHRFSWGSPFPTRKLIKQCGWLFKSDACGYTGQEDFCDKTYAQCTLYSNTDRFGGFRHIPERGHRIEWSTKVLIVE